MEFVSETSQSSYPSDTLSALVPYDVSDSFEGRANVYPSALADTPCKVDLFVHQASLNIGEHQQIEQHIGDSFELLSFGKAPTVLDVSMTLADCQYNYGKAALCSYYRNAWRLAAVARTGEMPAMRFLQAVVVGPWVSMRIMDDASSEDVLTVSASIMVFKATITGRDDIVIFDYTTGVDSFQKSEQTASAEEPVGYKQVKNGETVVWVV